MKLPDFVFIITVWGCIFQFVYTQHIYCYNNGQDHELCGGGSGMYCNSYSQYCEPCEPCGPSRNGNVENNPLYVGKCKRDFENEGVGECPNFCHEPGLHDVVPDYSICESELLCDTWKTLTGRNSSTARVTWQKPKFKPEEIQNIIHIQQAGSNISNGSVFPIGTTPIYYEAVDTNDGSLKAQCTVNITVIDASPPQITCPDDIIAYTSKSKHLNISWSKPLVSDNSGNWTLKLLSPGDPTGSDIIGQVPGESTLTAVLPDNHSAILQPGNISVLYEAMDPSGNNNTCSFDIHIKDVNLVCLDNQTIPVVIGDDDNLNYTCNHPPDYEIPYGETTLECELFGKDEEFLASCSSVIVKKDGTSTTTTPSPPKNVKGLSVRGKIGIIVVAAIVIVLCVLCWQRKHQTAPSEKRSAGLNINNTQHPESQGLVRSSPSTSSDDNAMYDEMNERRSGPGSTRSNRSHDKPDGKSNHMNGDIHVPNGYIPLQDKDGDQAGSNSSSERTTPTGNPNVPGIKCSQTLNNLLDEQDLMQGLCTKLDHREQLWRSIGWAYGQTDDELKYFHYHAKPDTYPVTRQLFSDIKDKTLGDEQRKTINKLLTVLHARIQRSGADPSKTYEGAKEVYEEIRQWHIKSRCQACARFPHCP